jgi:hypothetical protein
MKPWNFSPEGPQDVPEDVPEVCIVCVSFNILDKKLLATELQC